MTDHVTAPRTGALAVVAAGATWSLLLLWLNAAGHAPSFVALPVPRDGYYLVQAVITIPWLLLMWWVGARVAGALAARGGSPVDRPLLGNRWGLAMAVPLMAGHLLPEMATFAVAGFDALRVVARFTLPLSTLASLVLGVKAVRSASNASPGRALLAAAVGLFAQSLLAGPVLR